LKRFFALLFDFILYLAMRGGEVYRSRAFGQAVISSGTLKGFPIPPAMVRGEQARRLPTRAGAQLGLKPR
jgi:hypothetical protein